MASNESTLFMFADVADGESVLEVCASKNECAVKIHCAGQTLVVEADLSTLLRMASAVGYRCAEALDSEEG